MELRRGKSLAPGNNVRSSFAVLLLLALTACGTGGGGSGSPTITEFVAEPATVAPGDSVILRWLVEDLDGGSLRLESLQEGAVQPRTLGEVTGQSSTAVIVEQTTTFRLIATGPAGTASRETTVTVEEPESPVPRIEEFRATPQIVKPGESVTLSWVVSEAERVIIEPLGEEVESSGSIELNPDSTTEYTLTASNEHGTSSATLTVEVDESNRLLFLVAGQSNASGNGLEEGGEFPTEATEDPQDGVRMLTPDLEWIRAEEPTHPGQKHSFLLRFGKQVMEATGADVYLVPSAVPGSGLDSWDPDHSANNFSRAKEMAEYASESLGTGFSAVIWYQGESDTSSDSERSAFIQRTDEVLQAFRAGLPGEPGIIFAQLSKRLWSEDLYEPGNVEEDHNLAYQIVREYQRLMEAGARTAQTGAAGESDMDRSYYYMAVTHDLPMSDAKHLSAEGQRTLGDRIAGLYLACIWQECSSPPGPRLQQVTLESTALGSRVLVQLSEPVNYHPDYDGYFAVFVDGQKETDLTVTLDDSQTIIELYFEPAVPPDATVEVRYMPPQDVNLYTWSDNVVKDFEGLPLPAFGMPVEPPPPGTIPGLRMPED